MELEDKESEMAETGGIPSPPKTLLQCFYSHEQEQAALVSCLSVVADQVC